MKFGVTSMGFDWYKDHDALSNQRDSQKKRRGRRSSSDSIGVVKLYSWLVIIVTAVSFYCLRVTTAQTEASENVTDRSLLPNPLLLHKLTSTSTVRPWPSHEFFQAVINEERTPVQHADSNSTQIAETKTIQKDKESSSVQSFQVPIAAGNTDSSATQHHNKPTENYDNITSTKAIIASTSPTYNAADFGKSENISLVTDKKFLKISLNNTKISMKLNTSLLPLPHNAHHNATRKVSSQHREFLFTNPDPISVQASNENVNSELLHDTNKHNSQFQTVESRHWVSILPPPLSKWSSSEDTIRNPLRHGSSSSTVSTNDELPFHVIRQKKAQTMTDLSPEFYAKLNEGITSNSNNPIPWEIQQDKADKITYITTKITAPKQPQHDYVEDDFSHGWWQDEENESYVPAPTRPPDFTRITWPYTKYSHSSNSNLKSSSTTQKADSQFQIITKSSTLSYPKIKIATATTSYPIGSHFPSSAQSGPNKISSSHWGSLGTIHNTAIPLRVSSGMKYNSIFAVTQSTLVEAHGHIPKIKISSEVHTTSTDSSTGETNYNSGNKHSIEVQNMDAITNGNFEENSPSHNLNGTKNRFESPTNLWYKPIINHHYSPSPSPSPSIDDYHGMDTGTGWTSVNVDANSGSNSNILNNSYISTQVPILIPEENQYPIPAPATMSGEIQIIKETIQSQNQHAPYSQKVKYIPQIIFKLWKYSNGTLELEDQKLIPGWILKDYGIKEDRVLNFDEIPRAIQRIVEEKIDRQKDNSQETELQLPTERQGFDGHWEQLPIIHPGENGHPQVISYPRPQIKQHSNIMTRKPVTLNYILWNPKPSSPVSQYPAHPVPDVVTSMKTPHDILLELESHEHDMKTALQRQKQHYLEYLKLSNNAHDSEPNWSAIEEYLKQQQLSKLPSYLPIDDSDSNPQSTLFPNFADKDISNLAAVSLILSYLNKDSNNQNSNRIPPYIPTRQPSPAPNIGSLFTPPQKDPAWDAVRPVLEHMLGNQHFNFDPPSPPHEQPPQNSIKATAIPPQANDNFNNEDNSWEETYPENISTPSLVNRFSLSLADLDFLPNGLFKKTSLTTTTASTTTQSPSRPGRTTTQKSKGLRIGVKHSPKPSSVVTKGETSYEDADSESDVPNDDLTKTLLTKIVKKKIKKKLKKFKKKNEKGFFDFDINFDVGLDFADILKKKVLGILALKYAPFLVLALATIAPTLLLCLPFILKALKHKLYGFHHHSHQTFTYPYTYAYPVSQHSYEDPNFDNGWGWGARGTHSKVSGHGATEIHHHFHDFPALPNSFQNSVKSYPYDDIIHGDYTYNDNDYHMSPTSYDIKSKLPSTDHKYIYGHTGLSNPFDSTVPFISVTVPAVPVTPEPQTQHLSFPMPEQSVLVQQLQNYQPDVNPQSLPLVPLQNYQADEYMRRIRQIGQNLGKLIGTQISDIGNQDAMQVILDSKKDAINQMLKKLNIFKAADLIPQLRDSEESNDDQENVYRRKAAHFRKRRRRSFYLQ